MRRVFIPVTKTSMHARHAGANVMPTLLAKKNPILAERKAVHHQRLSILIRKAEKAAVLDNGHTEFL